jgi:hypothetical protein
MVMADFMSEGARGITRDEDLPALVVLHFACRTVLVITISQQSRAERDLIALQPWAPFHRAGGRLADCGSQDESWRP